MHIMLKSSGLGSITWLLSCLSKSFIVFEWQCNGQDSGGCFSDHVFLNLCDYHVLSREKRNLTT